MSSPINNVLYQRRNRNFAGAFRGLTEKRGLFPRISNYFRRQPSRPSRNTPPTLDEADPALYARIQQLRRMGAEESTFPRRVLGPPLDDDVLSQGILPGSMPEYGNNLLPAGTMFPANTRRTINRTRAKWWRPSRISPVTQAGAKRKTLTKNRRMKSSTKKAKRR